MEGGRDLTINVKWGERGGSRGNRDDDEGEVQRGQRLGGKGDKGTTKVMIAGG